MAKPDDISGKQILNDDLDIFGAAPVKKDKAIDLFDDPFADFGVKKTTDQPKEGEGDKAKKEGKPTFDDLF